MLIECSAYADLIDLSRFSTNNGQGTAFILGDRGYAGSLPDALRAKDPALARSYLLGKLIAALLIQCIADQCRAISPYGVPIRRQAQPVA